MFQPSDRSSAIPHSSIYSMYHANASSSKPLPSVLIDFIAIALCEVIPFRMIRRRSLQQLNPQIQPIQQAQSQSRLRRLPELVYFIHKVTYQAGINCRTALVALILLDRAKSSLPKNAVSSYDTSHRLLLGALLTATKVLQGTMWAPATPPLTNQRLCDICNGLFSLNDINQVERAFLKLIQYRCWVDDKDVNDYVIRHRSDFAL